MNADVFEKVLGVYEGSDSVATRELYTMLQSRGEPGLLAVNLMRACKKSERAKVYRGRSHRSASYEGKQWAMGEVAKQLLAAPHLVTSWGWAIDAEQTVRKWVLYVDTPAGQVSFHTDARGEGPDYEGAWDGQRGLSAARIVTWAARLLS